VRVLRLHEVRSDPASLPSRRDLLGPDLVRGPLSTWQWIAFPRDPTGALFTRRHSYEDPGELGPLLRRCFSFDGAQHVGWGFRARVGAARWRPRSSRPMSAAHGFCFQRRSPHVSAHVASLCSHATQELADSRRSAHFGKPIDRARMLSFPAADRAASLWCSVARGRPRWSAMSTDVGPRSCDLRSKPEGLGPLHQAA